MTRRTRFARLASSIEHREHLPARRAKAIAATIGRKKYGKKRFQAMATAGRKRAAAGRRRHTRRKTAR